MINVVDDKRTRVVAHIIDKQNILKIGIQVNYSLQKANPKERKIGIAVKQEATM